MASSLKVSGNGLKALQDRLAKLKSGKSLKVGIVESATYPDGTSVATVAATNEFGNPANNQPPRPFMRNTIERRSGEWGDTLVSAVNHTNGDMRTALALLGEKMTGDIKEEINTLTEPALAESTIKAKGFDKPLIHTGFMRDRIDYKVDE